MAVLNRTLFFIVGLVFGLVMASLAAELSQAAVDPYIGQIRKNLSPRKKPLSYTAEIKQQLVREEQAAGGSYTAQIKKKRPAYFRRIETASYTAEQKKKLKPNRWHDRSAIVETQQGRSELQMRRPGKIRYQAGIRVGAAVNQDLTVKGANGTFSFEDVYGSGFAPNIFLQFDYNFMADELAGNLGIGLIGGFSYHKGNGRFEVAPNNPNGASFGTESQTEFEFYTMPAAVVGKYQLNALHYVRPYVTAGGAAIPYIESRDDGGSSNKGISSGLYYSGGINILMDWISSRSTWNLYREDGIKHYYLTIEYSKLTTLSGDVDIQSSGIYAGLAFEI